MRPKMIGLIVRKEILSTFRDRRAIVSNLLIPLLLMPVVMMGLPLLMGGIFASQATSDTEIAVQGSENLPESLSAFLSASNLSLVETEDVLAAVRSSDYGAGMVVPDDFTSQLDADAQPELQIFSRPSSMGSDLDASKVTAAVAGWQQTLVQERLSAAGIDPQVLTPVTISRVDASTDQQRSAGMLGWIIPFFIAIWSLAGGQMTAIDATAGEKERGTMESLLVAPIRRSEVVVGKWLATSTFGLLAATAAIVGYLIGSGIMTSVIAPRLGEGSEEVLTMMGGSMAVTPGVIVELLISSALLAGLIGALLIAIAMFARSFKEAQSYVAPLSFLLILPAVGLQFRDFLDVGAWINAVPILGSLLTMYDTVTGASNATGLLYSWVGTGVAVVLLLLFAYRNFKREGVIFRS